MKFSASLLFRKTDAAVTHDALRSPENFLVVSQLAAGKKVVPALVCCLLSSKICLSSKLKLIYKSKKKIK